MPPKTLNRSWFKNQLDNHGISQRKLAKMWKLQPAAITRIFSGDRQLKLEEATQFAHLVNVPLEEVLRAAGIRTPITPSERAPESIPVSGWVDSELNVHWDPPHGSKRAPVPSFGGKDVAVLRYQTTGTALESLDGTLVYFLSPKKGNVDARDCIGRMCVVEIAGGPSRLAVLKRGYDVGRYNLSTMDGKVVAEGVALKSIGVVVWMKF